jgi:hypothetical protein
MPVRVNVYGITLWRCVISIKRQLYVQSLELHPDNKSVAVP